MQRPKRRRYKDNPYFLNYEEESNKYTVSFMASDRTIQKIEISKEIYDAFDKFELEDLSQLNEYDNHIEHSEIYENSLEARVNDKPLSLEEIVIRKIDFDELKMAIDTLPLIQRRRIKKYYFDNKNEVEIAKEERVSQKNISKTLTSARRTLKKILKKQN